MFVVVFINRDETYTIVPEQWIYDLNEQKIRNYGNNPNQKDRIFYSLNGVENGIPNAEYEPNFFLPTTNVFPPSVDLIETCYYGYIQRFFGAY